MSDFMIENGVLRKYNGPGGDVVIPEGVTEIYFAAFESCTNLTAVTIPDGVTAIGAYAFRYCQNLKTIHIPNSVTTIGFGAFYSCRNLTSATIGNCVTSIGYSAFENCRSLTAVAIPDGVSTIHQGTFQCCENLVHVTIPDSVTQIDHTAFDFRDDLRIRIRDVSLLSGKLRICAALCFAEDGGENTDPRFVSHGKYLKANSGKLVETAVRNPALLTLLCREKWIKAKDLESYVAAVQQTGDTERIAMVLEYQNSGLTGKQKEKAAKQKEKQADTVFDRAMARMNQVGIAGLNFVMTGDVNTFENRKELKAFLESQGAKLQSAMSSKTDFLIMNDASSNTEKAKRAKELGIDIITEREFNDKAGRQFVIEDGILVEYRGAGGQVVIPDGVTSIGKNVFHSCKELTAVTIPGGVATIGEGAFQGCVRLSAVTLPDSVTTLGVRAFYGCESLTGFTIPDTVTTIRAGAFKGCRGLADDNGFLIIRNVLQDYFGSETHITIPEGVTEIEQYAFLIGGRKLICVTIPDTVTSIGADAFNSNHCLTTVTLGNGVKTVGIRAFAGCENLTTVNLPDKPISIDANAFHGCPRVQFRKRSS